ncbi:MAG: DJ-1/PfpI family protein [Nannocystaceae bacterium]|nr:DJ-1/PfpI family protein [Nannocystaceae bacterium]
MTDEVAVLLAPGFEEIEAVTVIDVLRRAGIEVTTLAVREREVPGAHGITVVADATLTDAGARAFAWVVLPGGLPGATTLRDDPQVQAFVRAQHRRGGELAAICAAPIALAQADVLHGRRVTSYPGFEAQLGDVSYEASAVVDDGSVVTSRGVGTALAFALALVTRLRGERVAAELAARMLVPRPPA